MTKGQNVGYIRVSHEDQNTARQLDGLKLDRVFEDRLSGKDTNRPQLAEMLRFVRDGDVLHVHSMDRLARNLFDLQKMVKELNGRGVQVVFVTERLTFTGKDDPMSTLMLHVLGAAAEFFRNFQLESQRQGIAKAKQEGKYKGGKPKLNPAQVAQLQARAAAGESKAMLAREFGIARRTVYDYL